MPANLSNAMKAELEMEGARALDILRRKDEANAAIARFRKVVDDFNMGERNPDRFTQTIVDMITKIGESMYRRTAVNLGQEWVTQATSKDAPESPSILGGDWDHLPVRAPDELRAYLRREMPVNTVIGDPDAVGMSSVSRSVCPECGIADTEQPAPVSATEPEDFETLAGAFFNDTRVMAPGKDVAAAMGGDYDAYDLRVKLYREWCKARTLRARVAELEKDVLVQHDMLKDLGESRQVALDRVAELERVTEEQVERAAPHVYDAMRSFDAEGARHPWVAGGNSDMQDKARRVLRAALTAARGGGSEHAPDQPTWQGESTEPEESGWYAVRRADGSLCIRAWGNDLWWIPLKDGWLSGLPSGFSWFGPLESIDWDTPGVERLEGGAR